MLKLPVYVSLVFGLTTFLAVFLFYLAANGSKRTLIIILAWLALQTPVALSGFYTRTDFMPPRCMLLFWPPVLFMVGLLVSKRGRTFLDSLNLKILTLLHIVRILNALVLFWLFANKAVPRLLTFEGGNFDLLAGLSVPVVLFFGFVGKNINKSVLRCWNLAGIALLGNLVVTAVLSGPFPFQRFAFDQPDVAFLYFPFVWMPCCVVPLLLLAHLAAIRQLQTGPAVKVTSSQPGPDRNLLLKQETEHNQ